MVLGEFIDKYIMGYVDPSIPPITTYMEDPNPNSMEAVQRKITKIALERAEKLGPNGITLREIRSLYTEDIPTIETRNLVADRTATTLREKRGEGLAMNPLQRLELFLTGRAFLGAQKRPGWKGHLPFYAFRCPIHGIVEDYPHGYNEHLDCPKCTRERVRSVHPDLVEKVVQEALDG